MVGRGLCITLALFAGSAWAGDKTSPAVAPPVVSADPAVEKIPDPSEWYAAVRQLPQRGSYLERIVIATSGDDKHGFVFNQVNADVFSTLSFLTVADAKASDWAYKINEPRIIASDDAGRMRMLMVAASVDAVLRLASPGVGELVTADAHGSLTVLGKAALGGTSEQQLAETLRSILGYDGMVLAQNGEFVLARTSAVKTGLDLFAAAIGKSSAVYVVPEEQQRGIALLALVRSAHGLSVFRVVSIKPGESLPFATKLVIEHRPANAP